MKVKRSCRYVMDTLLSLICLVVFAAIAPAAFGEPPEDYVNVIVNGEFAEDPVPEGPGYTGRITGWTLSSGHGHLLNDEDGPFYTSALGPIPQGGQVYGRQHDGYLSQRLSGLNDGERFYFRCRVNCREGDDGMDLTILLGSKTLWSGFVTTQSGEFHSIRVDGEYDSEWGDELTFEFENPGGDNTLLVDDVQFWTTPRYTITYSADPLVGGEASGPETIAPDENATVTVEPHDGFNVREVTATKGRIEHVADNEYALSNVMGDTSVAASFASDAGREPLPIILDTDMESDVDDVGALAMAHALADRGEIELLGVMVGAKNPYATLTADRVNYYFGRPNLPLGQLKGDGVDRDSRYAQQVAEEFPGRLESADDAPDAVALYREILAGQPDDSVVLVTIGYKTNVRDLLASGPCEHSDLDGRELAEQKFRIWICMGGRFPEGREANLLWDAQASVEAIDNWPTEIIFSGWEIGRDIYTGGRLVELPEDSPVRRSYQLFNNLQPHRSWDQAALLYAARALDDGTAADYWELSAPGRIVIDREDGSNTWEDDPAGTHRHKLEHHDPEEIAAEIDVLMMHTPSE